MCVCVLGERLPCQPLAARSLTCPVLLFGSRAQVELANLPREQGQPLTGGGAKVVSKINAISSPHFPPF